MATAATAELEEGQRALLALLATIPDAALDWEPGGGEWSLKRIIAHIAHAYDFYILIVQEARGHNFGPIRLTPELDGWQRLLATDAAVKACPTVADVLAAVTQAYEPALALFHNLTPAELDHPFLFYNKPVDAAPISTTLRRRVLGEAANHLREHEPQVIETLARWQAAVSGR